VFVRIIGLCLFLSWLFGLRFWLFGRFLFGSGVVGIVGWFRFFGVIV